MAKTRGYNPKGIHSPADATRQRRAKLARSLKHKWDNVHRRWWHYVHQAKGKADRKSRRA